MPAHGMTFACRASPAGLLVNCTQQLCPYAVPSPSHSPSVQHGSTPPPVWINRVPYFGRGAFSLAINKRAPLNHQWATWRSFMFALNYEVRAHAHARTSTPCCWNMGPCWRPGANATNVATWATFDCCCCSRGPCGQSVAPLTSPTPSQHLQAGHMLQSSAVQLPDAGRVAVRTGSDVPHHAAAQRALFPGQCLQVGVVHAPHCRCLTRMPAYLHSMRLSGRCHISFISMHACNRSSQASSLAGMHDRGTGVTSGTGVTRIICRPAGPPPAILLMRAGGLLQATTATTPWIS